MNGKKKWFNMYLMWILIIYVIETSSIVFTVITGVMQ